MNWRRIGAAVLVAPFVPLLLLALLIVGTAVACIYVLFAVASLVEYACVGHWTPPPSLGLWR